MLLANCDLGTDELGIDPPHARGNTRQPRGWGLAFFPLRINVAFVFSLYWIGSSLRGRFKFDFVLYQDYGARIRTLSLMPRLVSTSDDPRNACCRVFSGSLLSHAMSSIQTAVHTALNYRNKDVIVCYHMVPYFSFPLLPTREKFNLSQVLIHFQICTGAY